MGNRPFNSSSEERHCRTGGSTGTASIVRDQVMGQIGPTGLDRRDRRIVSLEYEMPTE
jgi:hypothetical protein